MKLLMRIEYWLLLILAICEGVLGQQKYFEAKLVRSIYGEDYFVDFYIRSLQSNEVKLGFLSLAVSFNDSALLFIGKVDSLDGKWDDSNPAQPGSYLDIFASKLADLPIVTLNVTRSPNSNPNLGEAIPQSFERVGRLHFKIIDPLKEKRVMWNLGACGITDWSTYVNLGQYFDFIIDPIVVPVELISFNATSKDGSVIIEWETKSETNNLGFEVYRSETKDGVYSRVTKQMIKGAGTSENKNNYNLIDKTVEVNKHYFYKLVNIDYSGEIHINGPVEIFVSPPSRYALSQNYPNPFNSNTKIEYLVKEEGRITIEIFNISGQLIKVLVDNLKPAGSHMVVWDGLDDSNHVVASGIYFYKMSINGFKEIKKMQFLK